MTLPVYNVLILKYCEIVGSRLER